MSFPGRPPLLPAPAQGKTVASRAPARNGASQPDNPGVHVFIGNISAKAPDGMTRALLAACGPVISWKRAGTFGFCEFGGVEAALRCVRLLHDRSVADRRLVARVDGKMQALVDTYKSEQRSRLSADDRAPGTDGGGGGGGAGEEGGYLDARGRAMDDAVERKLVQILHDYQHEINNYETLQKEEAISKTARVLEEADISEEKRDVIHREIGKFRESMKGEVVVPRKRDKDDNQRDRERDKDRDRERDKEHAVSREKDRDREREKERERDRDRDTHRADKDRRRRSGSRMASQDIGEHLKATHVAAPTTPRHPDPALPPFDPDADHSDAASWCDTIEALSEDMQWSTIERAAQAGKALKGSAFTWFQSWEPSGGRTWENFRTDFIDSFRVKNLSEKLSEAVSYSSDSAESYGEYAREKLRLLRDTQIAFTDEQLIELVCGGISEADVRTAFSSNSVTTTSALTSLLSICVKTKKTHVESNNIDSSSGPRGSKQFRAADENQYGHYGPSLMATTQPRNQTPQGQGSCPTNFITCTYCQRFGDTVCTCFHMH